jgi:hypothetical protein
LIIDPGFPDAGGSVQTFRESLHHYLVPSPHGPHKFDTRLEIVRRPASEALRELFATVP